LEKGNLRAKDINQILAGVIESKKAAYDKNYIESLYMKYQNDIIDDTATKKYLKNLLDRKTVLILAPGNSLNTSKETIDKFIEDNDTVIISANYDDIVFGTKYNFYSNIKRFDQYLANDSEKNILITSNIRKVANGKCIVFNYYDLACDENGLFDNCVIMLFRLLDIIGVKEVNIAGFDGFSNLNPNYAYNSHTSDKQDKSEQNKIITNRIAKLRKKMKINFITPSFYTK
jgi:4-hydroxy 2-oxovalerate aldolase